MSLNAEKTRTVTLTDPRSLLRVPGLRRSGGNRIRRSRRGTRTRARKRKKVIEVLRKVRNTLRGSRHLSVQDAVARVNPIVRGWVNYFRVGNSSRELDVVRTGVERKVRRFAVKKLKRKGFGWTRWSSEIVYGTWGLFDDYQVRYYAVARKRRPAEKDP